MIIEEEVYLEHFGKKGMRWGVRTAKSVGRGAKKTFQFSKNHPKTTATIVAGASFAAVLLGKKIKTRSAARQATKMNSDHMKRLSQSGFAWKSNNSANWNYSLPQTNWNEATRGLR